MNLNKAKSEVNKLKKEISKDSEPSRENFFKFCKKELGRPADYGEIYFSTYYRDGMKIESEPIKFLRLSEKYYKEMHQVTNPVKDGEYGMKWRAVMHWVLLHNKGKSSRALQKKTMDEDQEFNNWFEDAWKQIIVDGDCTKYNQLIIDSRDVF